MNDWKPVKKIVATFVGAGITWLALRAGVDLGPEAINQGAAALVGIVAGYLTKS